MNKFYALILLLLCNLAECGNNIPPRYQWDSNCGYCGEVSLISAGLYYGQYISQYDARKATSLHAKQTTGQLLLGVNDQHAAAQMHLNVITWDTDAEQSTDQFLVWVKENVLKGYPVAIGIFTNEYLFYGNTNPDAGDHDYDHIVPVLGIDSSSDEEDLIYFSDNGLWGTLPNPPYYFCYPFETFQANRQEANESRGNIYSLNNNAKNYGIAITGVLDLNGDTLPVRVTTSVNDETPEIIDGSNSRPPSMPLTLTITVSGLEPGVAYNLYRYNDLATVPNSNFNAHAHKAYQQWPIQINSGSTYVMTQEIASSEQAIYRAVKVSAP